MVPAAAGKGAHRISFLRQSRTTLPPRIWILRRDEARAAQLVRMGGCDCACRWSAAAFPAVFGGLRKRPRAAGIAAGSGYRSGGSIVPKYRFFLRQSRATRLSRRAQILRELQELGVGFGTYGPSIKPQELKNQMLLRIPKLQWLTVQQSGMCARRGRAGTARQGSGARPKSADRCNRLARGRS